MHTGVFAKAENTTGYTQIQAVVLKSQNLEKKEAYGTVKEAVHSQTLHNGEEC